MLTDGTVWAAGPAPLGNGAAATRLYPVTVAGLTGVTSVSTAFTTTYAVDAAGQAWSWGYGRQGNLGDGRYANSSVPVKVIDITGPVTAVATQQYVSASSFVSGGVGVTVARGADGSLWSWGNIGFGSLGGGGRGADPGRIPRIPPVTGPFGIWFGAVS